MTLELKSELVALWNIVLVILKQGTNDVLTSVYYYPCISSSKKINNFKYFWKQNFLLI